MRLNKDEIRALAFVLGLIALAAAARLRERPAGALAGEAALDLAVLEEASEDARAAEERRSRPLEPGEKIDPNTAPAEELDRLPRVGPTLAARIVAAREDGGPFRTLADLDRVSGVGERTLELLAPHLDLPTSSWSTAWTPPPRPVSPRSPRAAAAPWSPPLIDPNTATAAQLESLPGVGPVLAARIVAYRDSLGGLRTLEQLDRVPGIGPATLERIAPLLRLEP